MPGPRSQLLVNQLVTGVEIASQRPLPRSSRPTTLRPGTSRRHAPCTDTDTGRPDCWAEVEQRPVLGRYEDHRHRPGPGLLVDVVGEDLAARMVDGEQHGGGPPGEGAFEGGDMLGGEIGAAVERQGEAHEGCRTRGRCRTPRSARSGKTSPAARESTIAASPGASRRRPLSVAASKSYWRASEKRCEETFSPACLELARRSRPARVRRPASHSDAVRSCRSAARRHRARRPTGDRQRLGRTWRAADRRQSGSVPRSGGEEPSSGRK